MIDGWCYTLGARALHYYRDGRRLCDGACRANVYPPRVEVEESQCCPRCLAKLEKELGNADTDQ